jgi:hypothetical protein
MYHASAASFADATPIYPPAMPPLKPWEYLRLRRMTSGKSIEQVARELYRSLSMRAGAVELVRLLETPGWRAKDGRTIAKLATIFPFDPGVYRQLADRDLPPEEHPPVCRGCGSSYWDRQRGPTEARVEWAASGLCSGCDAEAHAQ